MDNQCLTLTIRYLIKPGHGFTQIFVAFLIFFAMVGKILKINVFLS